MIAQILLAAGKSTRMGYPKPLLDFDGRLLLDLLLDECRQADLAQIVVVLGHNKERIEASANLAGTQIAANAGYESGQTSSLQCGLLALRPDVQAFINLPVDHPLVTRAEIDALVHAFRRRRGREKLFIPEYQGQEGRPVLFDITVRDSILALPPGTPVNQLLLSMRHETCRVPIDNPNTMLDVDTPEQYRDCLEIFRSLREDRLA